jgi:putative hemolysin
MTLDLSAFKAKNPFTITNEDFVIRIAESPEDIRKTQKLRHDIFLEEWQGKRHETGLDYDEYDAIADHLMIIDRKNDELVGTYRVIHSSFSKIFYSQTEFHLDEFLNTVDGGKLEMGRGCTHADYRNGRTMDLLWQGLAKYITMTKTRYLFGCSSVTTSDPKVMFSMLKGIQNRDELKLDYNIHPVPKYTWPDDKKILEASAPMEGFSKQLPPLLRSYLNAGSFVYGMPAWDADFNCFDLFTILDLTALDKRFYARYAPEGGWGF